MARLPLTILTKPVAAALLGALGCLLACAASAPGHAPAPTERPRPVAPPPAPAATGVGPGAPVPVASAVGTASASAMGTAGASAAAASAGVAMPVATPPVVASVPSSAACPVDMVLVTGDYCTDVEHDCLIEWWAPQNKKQVCEQFAPAARCVGARVRKRYCIDRFAWPNRQGVRPEVMNTFYQAEVKCAAAGKRMCTESEWTFACEGPQMKPFPYGYVRDPRKCNGDHRWDGPDMTLVAKRDPDELARLWRGVPSGTQPGCVSDFGVHDLPGNVDEVVAGESPKARYSSVNTGGPWYSGVRNQCRPKVYTHGEDFYYYFLGFRCCAEADGGANEPRTARQIREGWAFARVENIAGFGVVDMRAILARKEQGDCPCGPGERITLARRYLPVLPADVLCRTMCGTLLGPGARDADDSTRVLHASRRRIREAATPAGVP